MIYPINEMIDTLLASAVDPETGELTLTDEELEAKITELQISFDEKIDSLASMLKNMKAEAEAIKAEKINLGKRQSSLEKQADRTKRFIAYLLKGEKFKNGRHSISYRKSVEVVLDDEFLAWARKDAPGLLIERDPDPDKRAIKEAIEQGVDVPHATLNEKNNIQVR